MKVRRLIPDRQGISGRLYKRHDAFGLVGDLWIVLLVGLPCVAAIVKDVMVEWAAN